LKTLDEIETFGTYVSRAFRDDETDYCLIKYLLHANFVRIGSGEFLTEYSNREYYLDGIELGAATYESSLINGRGRYPEDDSSSRLPLAEYQLDSNGGCDQDATDGLSNARCRFRCIFICLFKIQRQHIAKYKKYKQFEQTAQHF